MANVLSITVERLYDNDPDLSWLDATDDDMGTGFEAYASERKKSYGDEWWMIGIRASAQVAIGGVPYTITSTGLWGIESDSEEDQLVQIGEEEIRELHGILEEMGL